MKLLNISYQKVVFISELYSCLTTYQVQLISMSLKNKAQFNVRTTMIGIQLNTTNAFLINPMLGSRFHRKMIQILFLLIIMLVNGASTEFISTQQEGI